jgi:drug/metabolite transporter (DMT)-like permease
MDGALRPSTSPAAAYAGLACATIGWAAAFIAGKIVLAEMTPLPVAAWRYAAATVILLPFALRRVIPGDLRATAVPLGIMVVCGGVFYPWLFLLALARTSAINAALLIALNPVLTLLLSPLAGEHPDRRRLVGVALALTGAATVITAGDPRSVTVANRGDLLAVAAAASWAAFNLAARSVAVRLPGSVTNCVVYGAGCMTLGFLGRREHPWAQLAAATAAARGGLLTMAVLSSVLAGQLFLVGVRTVGVSRTVVFVYLVPVVTAVLSVALLGESLRPAHVLGGAGVLAGVYWTTRDPGRRGAVPATARHARGSLRQRAGARR